MISNIFREVAMNTVGKAGFYGLRRIQLSTSFYGYCPDFLQALMFSTAHLSISGTPFLIKVGRFFYPLEDFGLEKKKINRSSLIHLNANNTSIAPSLIVYLFHLGVTLTFM